MEFEYFKKYYERYRYQIKDLWLIFNEGKNIERRVIFNFYDEIY
jgi:hypothetical protein